MCDQLYISISVDFCGLEYEYLAWKEAYRRYVGTMWKTLEVAMNHADLKLDFWGPPRVKCKNQLAMLAFLGYCASGRRTKNVKKTMRNACIFYGFFVDLNVIFRPGGTPGASRAPLNTKVGSHVDF